MNRDTKQSLFLVLVLIVVLVFVVVMKADAADRRAVNASRQVRVTKTEARAVFVHKPMQGKPESYYSGAYLVHEIVCGIDNQLICESRAEDKKP